MENEYFTRINRVVAFISANLASYLSLERLAQVAAFRLSHDCRGSVTHITLECGFASTSGFARAFRRRFGQSAEKWRRQRHCAKSKPSQSNSKTGEAESGDFRYIPDRLELVLKAKRHKRPEPHTSILPDMRAAYLGNWGYNAKIWRTWDRLLAWASARGYRDLFQLWLPGSGFQPDNKPCLELYPLSFKKNRFSVELCLPVKPL